MSSELYSQDYEGAEKEYEKFIKKTNKKKGIESKEADSDAVFDTTLRTANSTSEYDEIISAHVLECTQALRSEWKSLEAQIDTFEKYQNNTETVEEFHTHIEDSAKQLLKMICDYGTVYAEMILQQDSDPKEKYKAFEDFKDTVYEDACETIKDEIYEDLLEDVKDYYYDGIIDDAKDDVPYSDWSDARSDSYDWWSDARSEVYSCWSDTRGDLYSFYSDVRGELYSKDVDGANDELNRFKQKLSKSSKS